MSPCAKREAGAGTKNRPAAGEERGRVPLRQTRSGRRHEESACAGEERGRVPYRDLLRQAVCFCRFSALSLLAQRKRLAKERAFLAARCVCGARQNSRGTIVPHSDSLARWLPSCGWQPCPLAFAPRAELAFNAVERSDRLRVFRQLGHVYAQAIPSVPFGKGDGWRSLRSRAGWGGEQGMFCPFARPYATLLVAIGARASAPKAKPRRREETAYVREITGSVTPCAKREAGAGEEKRPTQRDKRGP